MQMAADAIRTCQVKENEPRTEEPVPGSQAVVCRNQLHCALYCTTALTASGALLQPEAAVLTFKVRVDPAE